MTSREVLGVGKMGVGGGIVLNDYHSVRLCYDLFLFLSPAFYCGPHLRGAILLRFLVGLS